MNPLDPDCSIAVTDGKPFELDSVARSIVDLRRFDLHSVTLRERECGIDRLN
jgi:hypothetical protein